MYVRNCQVPLSLSMQHHDICMRLTHENSKCAKAAFIACAYDTVVRESLAEKSKANCQITMRQVFTTIGRDLFERKPLNLVKFSKKNDTAPAKASQWYADSSK